MRLAYIDESYDRERFVLAALVVDGAAAVAICGRLDDLVVWANHEFGTSVTAEIHAHPLLNLKGDWARLPHDPRLRLRMARAVVTGVVAEGSRIVDTIYFAPSGSSRMLQAVDTVAYLARRARAEGRSPSEVRPATCLWSEVAGIARWVTVAENTSTPGDRG